MKDFLTTNVKIKLLKHTIYSYRFTSWGTVHPDKISSYWTVGLALFHVPGDRSLLPDDCPKGEEPAPAMFVVNEEWFADTWVVFHSWILREIYRVELPWEHGAFSVIIEGFKFRWYSTLYRISMLERGGIAWTTEWLCSREVGCVVGSLHGVWSSSEFIDTP